MTPPTVPEEIRDAIEDVVHAVHLAGSEDVEYAANAALAAIATALAEAERRGIERAILAQCAACSRGEAVVVEDGRPGHLFRGHLWNPCDAEETRQILRNEQAERSQAESLLHEADQDRAQSRADKERLDWLDNWCPGWRRSDQRRSSGGSASEEPPLIDAQGDLRKAIDLLPTSASEEP